MGYTRKDMLGGNASGDGVWVHCISRCVRRAYLCGDGLDHRKDWIERRLRLIAQTAAVEGFCLCGDDESPACGKLAKLDRRKLNGHSRLGR